MNNVESVPYIVHEAAQARLERTIKRLTAIIILLIILIVGTNAAWIIYESSFETITVTQESDASDGGAAITNNGGDLYYGTQ